MGNVSDLSPSNPYCRLCYRGVGWYNKCDDCSICLKEREREKRKWRENFIRREENIRKNRETERRRKTENKINIVFGNLNSIVKNENQQLLN